LLWSFAYLVVRNLFALVWLLARPRRSKELEILVLRHEFGHISPTASRTGSPRFCGWNRRESSASGCSPRTRTFGRALSSWPSPLAYEPELKWYLRAGQGLRVCECERLGGGTLRELDLPASWEIRPGGPSLCTPRVRKIRSCPDLQGNRAGLREA